MLRSHWKNFIYSFAALGMLGYAVPQLQMGYGVTAPTIFGVVWLAFALLVVASQLHFILGVDKEMKENLARIQKMKKWRLEQKYRRRTVFEFQAKK